ncbi:AraC-like DNA-binding protein [Sphingomonas jejuensis]|uniref:AraC-like DNA-binding protein n=1 Tax=Sphingomonas jejuensis TaxID=904715 RepID=A0ABX0XPI9_9SPHN|nr:AraC family transcriptional regulator [Sphingomonas jejuensis]NJC34580.1 AraC-like DNA-binding protein [Sphingomonas jejuensis]
MPFSPGAPAAAAEGRGGTPAALLDAVGVFLEQRGGGEGHFQTPMEGVHMMRLFHEVPPVRRMYRPSLCVVLRGAKEILFGETTLRYGEMECLVVSVEVPASGRMIGASPDTPYLGMTIEFDVAMLREVIQQLASPPLTAATAEACVFVGQVDGPLADCVTRIARMASTPEAAQVLYPSVMREICYWLLTGPHGADIAKLAVPDTHTERVANAIYYLRDHFAQSIRVEQLAEVARMSLSSFHQHFRAMTSMTPVQYQKQLRLLEARRLMVADAANVSEAAYQVGYESASQFSREYSRAFGTAPKRDAMNFKALVAAGTR